LGSVHRSHSPEADYAVFVVSFLAPEAVDVESVHVGVVGSLGLCESQNIMFEIAH